MEEVHDGVGEADERGELYGAVEGAGAPEEARGHDQNSAPPASPLPLAFFAFGAGSLMLGGVRLDLVPASETGSVAIV